LNPRNDLRQILILDLEVKLSDFRKQNIDLLSHVDLQRWGKFVSEVPGQIERAEQAIEQGQKFLNVTNLSILRRLVSEKSDLIQFDQFLKSLDGYAMEFLHGDRMCDMVKLTWLSNGNCQLAIRGADV
jgi:hypothetical protein